MKKNKFLIVFGIKITRITILIVFMFILLISCENEQSKAVNIDNSEVEQIDTLKLYFSFLNELNSVINWEKDYVEYLYRKNTISEITYDSIHFEVKELENFIFFISDKDTLTRFEIGNTLEINTGGVESEKLLIPKNTRFVGSKFYKAKLDSLEVYHFETFFEKNDHSKAQYFYAKGVGPILLYLDVPRLKFKITSFENNKLLTIQYDSLITNLLQTVDSNDYFLKINPKIEISGGW